MTREEAIKIIQKEYKCVNRDCDIERSCGKCEYMMPTKEPILEAYKMAISALEQEPITTSTDEPMTMVYPTIFCEDMISINAVDRFGVLNEIYEWTISGEYEQPRGTDILIKRINNMPSVQPSRKGHWIEVAEYSDGKHKIECSECGNYIFDRGHANSHNVKEKYKYCNYCGADMRGE